MIRRCRLDDAGGLQPDAIEAYARDGVLVIEGFASPARRIFHEWSSGQCLLAARLNR